MRILMTGGIQYRNDAARYYGVPEKLINGFIRAGHSVLHFADRDAARNSTPFKSRKLGVKKANQEFLNKIQIFQPELIIFKHADVIQPDTLKEIRNRWPHIRMAQVNVDALFNPDNIERIKNKSGLVDVNFITTYGDGVKRIKVNNKPVYYIPNPVDISIESEKAFEQTCISDLFLALGSFHSETDSRKNLIDNLKKKLPDLNFSLHIAGQGNGLWGADYFNTLKKCKAGLNLSRKEEKPHIPGTADDYYLYSSDRIAHYIGNGLLTYSDNAFSLHELFKPEKEMVFYSSAEELADKVKFYQKNDSKRIEIAKAGYTKAHQDFNSTLVARFIVEVTMEQKLSNYQWPTSSI